MEGCRIVSFQGAPGRREGFWSDSKTEMSFLGRLTLMKVQLSTFSASVVSRSTRLFISGARGGAEGSPGKISLSACTQNSNMALRSVSSNCFLALKCTSQGRPTSEDLTVVAYSCMSAPRMEQPTICIWRFPLAMSVCCTSASTILLSSPRSSTLWRFTMMAMTCTRRSRTYPERVTREMTYCRR